MPAIPASAGHGLPPESSCRAVRAEAEARATVPFSRSSVAALWCRASATGLAAAGRFHHGVARLPVGVVVRYGTTDCDVAGVGTGAVVGAVRWGALARCLPPLGLRCAPPWDLVGSGRWRGWCEWLWVGRTVGAWLPVGGRPRPVLGSVGGALVGGTLVGGSLLGGELLGGVLLGGELLVGGSLLGGAEDGGAVGGRLLGGVLLGGVEESVGTGEEAVGTGDESVGADEVGAGEESVGADDVGAGEESVGTGPESVGTGPESVGTGPDSVGLGAEGVGLTEVCVGLSVALGCGPTAKAVPPPAN